MGRYLSRAEAAAWLTSRGIQMRPQALANLAWRDLGPSFTVIHRRAYYTVPVLRAWLRTQAERNTRLCAAS